MANIDVEVAGRRYDVACRDGEEDQLRAIAALVDRRAKDAAAALGSLTETRQLLFASLLLADDVRELRSGGSVPQDDPALVSALERIAERIENLAARLEQAPASA